MVSINSRSINGSPLYPYSASSSASASGSAGGTFRLMGRRRMSKFRFRVMILLYVALGCVLPYYVMKYAEDEQIYQQELEQQHQQHQQLEQIQQQQLQLQIEHETETQPQHGAQDQQRPPSPSSSTQPQQQQQQHKQQLQKELTVTTTTYKRKAFFEDLVVLENGKLGSPPNHAYLPPTLNQHRRHQEPSKAQQESVSQLRQRQGQILEELGAKLTKERKQSRVAMTMTLQDYEVVMKKAVEAARAWVEKKMPEDIRVEKTRIPGTQLDTPELTMKFRTLMDGALNQGRWVYEAQRDYPDFGGATGWNKKKQNERDRDVAIDRPPFPEAGKYHWEPIIRQGDLGSSSSLVPNSMRHGWHANRIPPEDFCQILGPRHIVLVGDMIHWQLHDSIMYNMFDNPQACYGDLACHLGVGHPLCPMPNDVRLKFVRNDLLSTVRPKKSRINETKTQDPVEMPWLRDMKLKDTVILGATHQSLKDKQFQRRLTDTVAKIRRARPEALIIYRNNPVGHPECPSRGNGFNLDRDKQGQAGVEESTRQQDHQPQQKGQKAFQIPNPLSSSSSSTGTLANRTTFAAPARPLEHDIPLQDLLQYPLNWVHYDRQNRMAKEIIEATGGIYWNVATMTNKRPDGHVGGQDCLGYRRPGPTDEWAVSLYNLFKTIQQVEQKAGGAH